ncbi:MAG: glutaminyl-tRNA synthase (glutamine-hydrolyzing) subunit A [Candidatus Amoebophilus sp. 36-38]|nr:MAG: glutaminyl-tRNA synthase (glutamine-hydrolyzing) subunit A [Candidatus Amoebophilus sp. 36-38]
MHKISELKSFSTLINLLEKDPTSCIDLTRECLDNISKQKDLNAFLRTYPEEALERAAQVATKLQAKKFGKLAGMVVGLKDLLCYQDHPVQGSSKILENFISQFSATAVQRLIDEDVIIIGHQNCDEFGMGSSNENSAFGPVRNAIDPTRVPGGSSGGSAAAVQANMCHVSLGTDTGGSVRQPAAFCGIVGLKPTYARISRHGMIAYASSFDTIGILAKDIRDCAAVLEVIAGPDTFDSTVAHQPVPTYTEHLNFGKKAKIAYLKETLAYEGLQEEIKNHTLSTMQALQEAGHQVEAIDFPLLPYALPTYYVITNAEASANLARLDGVRYGYRTPNAHTLEELYTKTRSEGFGEEVKRRILLGTFVLGANQYESCYVKAQKIRGLIKNKLQAILATYDFILLPTTPSTAFEIGRNDHDPLAMYWADVYTTLASIAGLPAISIPNGVDKQDLPIGLQIIANSFEEAKLLGFANHVMQLPKKV